MPFPGSHLLKSEILYGTLFLSPFILTLAILRLWSDADAQLCYAWSIECVAVLFLKQMYNEDFHQSTQLIFRQKRASWALRR